MLKCTDDLGSIEVHVVSYLKLASSNTIKKITALDEFHLDVHFLFIVEGRVRSHDERTIVALLAKVH